MRNATARVPLGFAALLLTLSAGVAFGQAFNFHDHYKWNPANEHVYRLTPMVDLWPTCQAYATTHSIGAASIPGNLATIRSAQENQFCYDGEEVHIGLIEDGGSWKWVSGEPLSWTNWHPDEPDPVDAYGRFVVGGLWAGGGTHHELRGLMEFVPPVPGAYADHDGDGTPDAFEDYNNNGTPDGFEDWNGDGVLNLFEWAEPFHLHFQTHPDVGLWYNSNILLASWSTDRATSATNWGWLIDGNYSTTVTAANCTLVPITTTATLVTGLSANSHYFHLSPLGASGNPTTASQQNRQFNINGAPPRVSSSTHPDPLEFFSPSTATFTLDYPEETSPASFSYLYALTDSSEHDFSTDGYTTASLGNVTIGGLSDGRHYLHATTVDTVGTTSTATATFPILIGESGVALAGDVTTDTVTDRPLDAQVWATEPNDQHTPVADTWYAAAWPTDPSAAVTDVALTNETMRTVTWDTTRVDDGTYDFAATYVDSNGTTQTAKSPARLTVFASPLSLNSPTHPHSSRWYETSDVTLNWQRPGDCAPHAFRGFRYLVDRQPDTVPDESADYASTDTLTLDWHAEPTDYGRNFFHIRWIDRWGRLSNRTTHFPFNTAPYYSSNYQELPWYDPFTSFRSDLWYRSSATDVFLDGSELKMRARTTLVSISQQFNHTEPHEGPYQIDVTGLQRDADHLFAIIAMRSDNRMRYTNAQIEAMSTDLEKLRHCGIVNGGIEVSIQENDRIEIIHREMRSGTSYDQMIAGINGGITVSGKHSFSVLDTGSYIAVYMDDSPVPVLEGYDNTVLGGGFLFFGGRYPDDPEITHCENVRVFRPTRPSPADVGIRSEADLLHLSTSDPVFVWDFQDDDDRQYMYQVQVQLASRPWTDLALWDSGQKQGTQRVLHYGAGGGTPSTAPALEEGVRYKFRVRVKDRTLWSHTWVGDDYLEWEFEINTEPDISHLAITPGNPTTTDDLLAEATVSDTLGEDVALSWVWHRDGEWMADLTGNTVPAARTGPGQSWRVTVTPNDGFKEGESRSASVLVSGAPSTGQPSVASISVDGNHATDPTQIDSLWHLTNASPEIGWTYTDPDSDPQGAYEVEVRDGPAGGGSLVWGSGEVSGSASSVACGIGLGAGTTVHVRVRVSDGAAWSEWHETPCRLNAAPSVPIVKIEPGPTVGEADELHGVAMATDADGDAVVYEYEWQCNGGATGHDTRTLPAEPLVAGDSWTLKARASDGIVWSDWAESAAVTVDGSVAHHASIEYDANGNMTRNGDRTFEFDTENRLRKVRNAGVRIAEYWYDQGGQRVRKAENGKSTFYAGKHYEIAGVTGDQPTSVTKYYYAGRRRLAEVDPHDEVFFYHLDHLGGTHVVSDAAGTSVSVSEHYPYGAQRTSTGDKDLTKRFTGKELDSTGLYYYEARYYDREAMVFTRADSVWPDESNPQLFSRYAYVGGNPLKYIDPDGHLRFSDVGMPGTYEESISGPMPYVAGKTYTGPGGWSKSLDPVLWVLSGGVWFSPAGYEHDRMYNTLGISKEEADKDFLYNQLYLISHTPWGTLEQRLTAINLAYTTYYAVKMGGAECYEAAQADARRRAEADATGSGGGGFVLNERDESSKDVKDGVELDFSLGGGGGGGGSKYTNSTVTGITAPPEEPGDDDDGGFLSTLRNVVSTVWSWFTGGGDDDDDGD